MTRTFVAVVVLAVVGVLAGAWYFRPADHQQAQPPADHTQIPEPPELAEEPLILHPVPQRPAPITRAPDPQASDPRAVKEIEEQVAGTIDAQPGSGESAAEPPLPPLDKSDATVQKALADVAPVDRMAPLLHLENIVRRFVVSIDTLPDRKLPQRHFIARPTEGPFLVAGSEDEAYIDPANYERYTPYIQLMDALDTQKIADLYIRFYPLFQAAYTDLGYPSAYFNDRLVAVIDHLLATPDVQGRVKLVRPHVLYKFADPELEALSSGQKVLLRIGYDNAARVKAKLRELRGAVTVQGPAP